MKELKETNYFGENFEKQIAVRFSILTFKIFFKPFGVFPANMSVPPQ